MGVYVGSNAAAPGGHQHADQWHCAMGRNAGPWLRHGADAGRTLVDRGVAKINQVGVIDLKR